jgi:hypothetical protein
MRRTVRAGGLGLWLLVAVTTPAWAQRTTGEIIGKVTDESGSVLPGVTVTLRGAGVAGAPSVVTSDTGTYRFPVLPPGTYAVEYVLSGFATVRREAIPVAVGNTVELDITLKVSSLSETVTVTGESPVVNLASAQVATTYNREWLWNAPVRRFSYFDLINEAPGVSQTSQVGSTTSATSLGSSTNENQYQIDGTETSSTPWPNTDVVEEVEVLQLGASAEYGNVQGAVFNIVTRMGGNTLHGDGNVYFQHQNLTANNTSNIKNQITGAPVDACPSTASPRVNCPYNLDAHRDTTVQVSGPFIRDKFWFFGSLQYHRIYDSQPGVDPKFPAKSDARRLFWKFNYNITPNHRLLHGYHDDFYWIPDISTAFDAPSSLNMEHGHNPTPNLVYTGVLSKNTFIEGRFAGFWLQESNEPLQEGAPRIATRFVDRDTGFTTGGLAQWSEVRSWRYGPQVKLSHFAENFLGGSHDLKVGVQASTNGTVSLTGPNDTITTYGLTPGKLPNGTQQLPYYRGTNARWSGVYIDDTARVGDRMTLNLGVRYDYSKGYYPAYPFVDANLAFTGQNSAPNDDVYSYNVVSPRFGVNYKVNSRTVVKGHFGRYYSALERDFAGVVPSTTTLFNFDCLTVACPSAQRTNFTTTNPTNLRVDPDRKDPYSNQYIVQVEHELITNLGLQVNYVRKDGHDYTGWQDIAGEYQQVNYLDTAGIDATNQPVQVWRLVSPASNRLFLLTTPSGPDGRGLFSKYNGATFMLTKRMSHNWQGVISLVLSKSEGRIATSARTGPSSAQTSAVGTFAQTAAGPNDYVNTDGLLIGDKPVVAKAQVIYKFPWGIMAAVNAQHQTGRLWARRIAVSSPVARLGFPSAPQINMEPNSGDRRVADLNLIDLRAQKDFRLSDQAHTTFSVFLDALNMTNSAAFENVASQLGTSSSFGVPTRYILPRRLQLGAKIRW